MMDIRNYLPIFMIDYQEMNNSLRRRFSVAVSLGQISPEDYTDTLGQYKDYIHDVYFSPTESLKYCTRKNIYDFYSTSNEERRSMIRKILVFAQENGIEISLTLNSSMVSASEMADIFELYQSWIHLDHLTTTQEVAKIIKQRNYQIPITCSYNEAIVTHRHLMEILNDDTFDTIVLGGRFLRDLKAFELVKTYGKNTVLMLNTGCCINCVSFCKNLDKHYCEDLFRKNLALLGIEYMYANQTVFPEEIGTYYLPSGTVDIFKLASRPIKNEELNNMLSSYTSLDSHTFIDKSKENYHLYGRLAHFISYYTQLNYKNILNYKESIWGKAIQKYNA